jgi:hypothetical protein
VLADVSIDEIDFNGVTDIIAKRRRRVLLSGTPAIDVSYAVRVLPELEVSLTEISSALTSGNLLEALREEGLTDVSSEITTVLPLPFPPPPPTVLAPPPPLSSVLTNSSDLALADDAPLDFSESKLAGLICGAITMLVLSVLYQHRSKVCAGGRVRRSESLKRATRSDDSSEKRSDSLNFESNPAEAFIREACRK